MVLNQYKNELLKALWAAGLNHADFALLPSANQLRITFKNTSFTLEANPNDPDAFSVAYTRFHSGQVVIPYSGFMPFSAALQHFNEWLKSQVQRSIQESSVPDLWSQLQQTDQFANSADDTYFSFEEKEQLKLSVEEFKLLIVKTFTPSTDEMKVVNERLDYLKDAIDRLNRFDWQSVAMSTLVSISIALSLDTEKGRILFGLFQQAFNAIVNLLK
jgi:hypothetical protein